MIIISSELINSVIHFCKKLTLCSVRNIFVKLGALLPWMDALAQKVDVKNDTKTLTEPA